MDLVQKLIQGNTYEEYEALFTAANLMDDEINIDITVIIDLTICNAGSITKEETLTVKQSLKDLVYSDIPPEYAEVIQGVLKEVQDRFSVPESLIRLIERLQRKLNNTYASK